MCFIAGMKIPGVKFDEKNNIPSQINTYNSIFNATCKHKCFIEFNMICALLRRIHVKEKFTRNKDIQSLNFKLPTQKWLLPVIHNRIVDNGSILARKHC